jgi:hypothetical protein
VVQWQRLRQIEHAPAAAQGASGALTPGELTKSMGLSLSARHQHLHAPDSDVRVSCVAHCSCAGIPGVLSE